MIFKFFGRATDSPPTNMAVFKGFQFSRTPSKAEHLAVQKRNNGAIAKLFPHIID